MSKIKDALKRNGMIAWMVAHPVTANLCMLVLLIGGMFAINNIKQEVFPEFDLDTVTVTVSYPGATPEEVENGIIKVIEENLEDLEGIDEMRSNATEGQAKLTLELSLTADDNKMYQDIKNTIDRIKTFPDNAEDPQVSLTERKRSVLEVILYGEQSIAVLKETAERIRDQLLTSDEVTNIEITGVRKPEIAVEISAEDLRRYNLTPNEVATTIKNYSLEMGGGTVDTAGGEVLLKVDQKRDYGNDFYNIPLLITKDGVEVQLGDVATITDDFEENDIFDYYNGIPTVRLRVYRTGDQTPKEVSTAVNGMIDSMMEIMPEGIQVKIWDDQSEVLNERMELLLKNVWMGLILVLLFLGCFLQVRLAFWVMMGIPISFLGSFLFLPMFDVSINMISLFAFITSLGMVVDDAIVVGENIFEMREKGMSFVDSAIEGTKQVAVPVTFSIITNVVAFSPLLFVPGMMGKVFKVMPIVVISVFIISLFEAVLILPAHLAHQKKGVEGDIWSKLNKIETWFGHKLQYVIHNLYKPVLMRAIRGRYITLLIFICIIIVFASYVMSGRLAITFFPTAASDVAQATIDLPYGSPVEDTKKIHDRAIEAAKVVANRYKEENGSDILIGIYSQIGSAGKRRGGNAALSGSHTTNISVLLVPTDDRSMSTTDFVTEWRKEVGVIAGAERSVFMDDPGGPTSGDPISISIAHSDVKQLEAAANDLAEKLAEYEGVSDIENGFDLGKAELDFVITPAGKSLGFTPNYVASQVRAMFYGVEALSQQRDRDEVKVMVRLPLSERSSLYDLEELVLISPTGGQMPFSEIVDTVQTRAATSIRRIDGQRRVNVAADIKPRSNAGKVISDITDNGFMDELKAKYPGLTNSLAGNRQDIQDSLKALGYGMIFALFVVYAVLAIPFNSYLQPAIIMVSIPFGIIGAALGHIIMGYDSLSLPSFMGIVALSGVVVNDSLVMVDYANNLKLKGLSHGQSVFKAGVRRFRPIMLTSLTTFGGLAPMIFETSRQAKFMIPMALSLGYGILFATFIALILVPSLYLIIEDIKRWYKKFWEWKIL